MPGAGAAGRSSASARIASRRSCTVLFMAGAGGSLRAGVTENPVRLTRSVQRRAGQGHLRRRAGLCLAGRRHHLHGRRDARCRRTAFGYVPTPALVAPIEFTMRAADYAALGGYRLARRRRCEDRDCAATRCGSNDRARRLPDGRLHLQHGPIDLIIEAFGARDEVERGLPPGHRPLRRHPADAGARAAAAAPPVGDGLSAAARPGRAAHGRGRLAASRRCSSRRWPRSPAPSPTRCCRRCWPAARSTRPMSTTAATSRSISRPATACAPASSPRRSTAR